jgi:hypothetical protein
MQERGDEAGGLPLVAPALCVIQHVMYHARRAKEESMIWWVAT